MPGHEAEVVVDVVDVDVDVGGVAEVEVEDVVDETRPSPTTKSCLKF